MSDEEYKRRHELELKEVKLYDRMGDYVLTTRDMHTALHCVEHGFGGCTPYWEGIDDYSPEARELLSIWNEKTKAGKIVYLADELQAAGFDVTVEKL